MILYGFPTEAAQLKWDSRMLGLARYIGTEWSKDPSSKVGCVIAQGIDEIGLGYNGFPPGVKDDPERYADRALKYELVIHAEPNALAKAARLGHAATDGATAYTWPFPPCSRCAGLLVRHGIKRVVSVDNELDENRIKACRFDLTALVFREAGVIVQLYHEIFTDNPIMSPWQRAWSPVASTLEQRVY